jgi:hypothetical protein
MLIILLLIGMTLSLRYDVRSVARSSAKKEQPKCLSLNSYCTDKNQCCSKNCKTFRSGRGNKCI